MYGARSIATCVRALTSCTAMAFHIDRNSVFDSAASRRTSVPGAYCSGSGDGLGRYHHRPVVLPKLYNGHNKTFSWQASTFSTRTRASRRLARFRRPPRTGDFNNFVNSNGVLIPIYDPQTGKQFQCNGKLNVICANRIDPLVLVASAVHSLREHDRNERR